MTKYAFSYVTGPTGSISGEAVLQQTADAINALGGYCVQAAQDGAAAREDAAAARSDAAAALSNVNSALSALPELQSAVQAATQAATQAQTVAGEAKGAASAAQAAARNAAEAVASQNSAISALGTRVAQAETAAAGAAETAQSAAETAQTAAETAAEAAGIARSAVVYDAGQDLRPVNQWTALQNIGAVPYIAPTSVTSVDSEGVETVRTYDLTAEQRTQARANIGAAAAADLTALGTRVQTLEEAGSSTDGAVRFDAPQALTALQQWQAAENAGAVPFVAPVTETVTGEDGTETEIVHQLSAEQQAQARANIGAAGADDIPAGAVLYDQAQTLNLDQQRRARTNISAMAASGDRGKAGGFLTGVYLTHGSAGTPYEVTGSSPDVATITGGTDDIPSISVGTPYGDQTWIKTVVLNASSFELSSYDPLWTFADGSAWTDIMTKTFTRLILIFCNFAGIAKIFYITETEATA